ncbi:hypothetical protein [Pseudomonas sp. H3(2019)]|uniref:hypothetical protein n=1 Tax=Pseudomonas sp. H3(2019) TaxID=2598724 RepID=UPI0015B38D4D|nr:hypothetical protein [Pseudomonas sp. H3(2019)]
MAGKTVLANGLVSGDEIWIKLFVYMDSRMLLHLLSLLSAKAPVSQRIAGTFSPDLLIGVIRALRDI